MLRTTLLAATLLATPIAALASGGYYAGGYSSGVVVAQPGIAVSIGAPLAGFNLYYQNGGYPYLPVAPVYYRAPVVVRAPYYPSPRIQYYRSRNDWHGGGRHYRDDNDYRDRGRGHGHGHDRDD
jgi:hypothetical protein